MAGPCRRRSRRRWHTPPGSSRWRRVPRGGRRRRRPPRSCCPARRARITGQTAQGRRRLLRHRRRAPEPPADDDRAAPRTFDVVVVGSGSAGSTAAIAAARAGAAVLLIEKLPFLGGTSTAVLDTFYGFYTPGQRRVKVVGGIARRRRGRAATARTGRRAAEHLRRRDGRHLPPRPPQGGLGAPRAATPGSGSCCTRFVQAADVRDGHVEAVAVATKAGLHRGPRARRSSTPRATPTCATTPASATSWPASVEPAQTLTTTFRMANVDLDRGATADQGASSNALMAEAAAIGRLRPAAPRGLRPRHPGRGHDGDDHDPARVVPPRGTIGSSTPPTRAS